MRAKIFKSFLLMYLAMMTLNAFAQRPFSCQKMWHWLILEENYDDPNWDGLMDAYIDFCM